MVGWLHRSGISGWWKYSGYFAVTPRCATSTERVFSSPRCALARNNLTYICTSLLSSHRWLHYPTIVSSAGKPSTLRRGQQTLSVTSNKHVEIFFYACQHLMCENVFKTLSVSQEWACDIYSRQDENKLFHWVVAVTKTNYNLEPLTAPSVTHPQVNTSRRLPTHLLLTQV